VLLAAYGTRRATRTAIVSGPTAGVPHRSEAAVRSTPRSDGLKMQVHGCEAMVASYDRSSVGPTV
jgi:hypothetical protein